MRPAQSRFVTACQQFLALAAVIAVLTPATNVISLDVVGHDGTSQQPTRHEPATRLRSGTLQTARVSTAVVDPVVKNYALTPPSGRTFGRAAGFATTRTTSGDTELVSRPVPVSGFGTVGITWDQGVSPSTRQAGFEVRTRTGSQWSGWQTLPYDPEHGPDPNSAEGRKAKPGTDPLLVGDVDQVQVRERTTTALPVGMQLTVIDPGTDVAGRVERPAIDTAALDAPSTNTPGAPADDSVKAPSDGLALQAASYTPKPQIFSRAQWGADESLRDPSSLHYFEVHAGFVHHTVNANDYTRDEVPALLRGIYAYHVRSRGWSDIGYNFLVDRFGRIWEGRYGGVDRPVVGAHTLGYNDYSFAMSAIGNYELTQPSDAVLRAYGRLFAWKLSLHGVDASSTSQWVGTKTFQAINGHRDAASTACPGKYLYAKLSTIRGYAEDAQMDWSGRDRQTDLGADPYPDLVARRASDGQAFMIPTGGLTRFSPRLASRGWSEQDTVVASPDLTGDGLGDLVVRGGDGITHTYPGDGQGGFGNPIRPTSAFADRDLITAVGDLNEDGRNDLISRNPATNRLEAHYGTKRGFRHEVLGSGWNAYRTVAGAGDVDKDGHVDVVAITTSGTMVLRRGKGDGRLSAPTTLPGTWSSYDALVGLGDYTHDGRPDLVARLAATGASYVLPAGSDGHGGINYGHPLGPFLSAGSLGTLSAANLTGTRQPDLVGLRGGRLIVLVNRGTYELGKPVNTGMNLAGANTLLNVGDWDRDGFGDVVARNSVGGDLYLHRGDGKGHFGAAIKVASGFGSVRLLAAVGDMTGDGYPDLMGQPSGGAMRIYPGAGLAGLRPSYVAYGPITAGRQIGVGRWDADGAPDSLMRQGPVLRLYPGNGPGGLVNDISTFSIDVSSYDWIVGAGNADSASHADLIVRSRTTGDLWLLQGSTDGFGSRRFLGAGFGDYDLVG